MLDRNFFLEQRRIYKLSDILSGLNLYFRTSLSALSEKIYNFFLPIWQRSIQTLAETPEFEENSSTGPSCFIIVLKYFLLKTESGDMFNKSELFLVNLLVSLSRLIRRFFPSGNLSFSDIIISDLLIDD